MMQKNIQVGIGECVSPNPIKITIPLDGEIIDAATRLKRANATLAEAKKEADSAKEILSRKILEIGKINVASLPVGSQILCAGGFLFEMREQSFLDQDALKSEEPGIFERFYGKRATKNFKPLV